MFRSILAVVFVVMAPWWASASDSSAGHVRSLDVWASESLEHGMKGAAVVRELVRQLAASNVVVYVETSAALPQTLAGVTVLVADAGGVRYARITLDRGLHPIERACTLAHELQHAVELAQSDARSQQSMRELFERIGYRVASKVYETRAARRAGARAWAELHGSEAAPEWR